MIFKKIRATGRLVLIWLNSNLNEGSFTARASKFRARRFRRYLFRLARRLSELVRVERDSTESKIITNK